MSKVTIELTEVQEDAIVSANLKATLKMMQDHRRLRTKHLAPSVLPDEQAYIDALEKVIELYHKPEAPKQ